MIFVYGLLRRGEHFHHLLSSAQFIGGVTTPAKYTLIDLGEYPAMLAGGSTAVVGEVYSVDDATLAVCAEAIGIMRSMHDKTVEYSKNRVQFGVPIGSFQALQHRMVDTLMACEQSQSLMMWAVMLNTADDADRQRAVSAMKYQIGTAGINVAREGVQIHGGMGVTWELDIAHYFKRLTAIDLLFGNADFHLDRYVRLST